MQSYLLEAGTGQFYEWSSQGQDLFAGIVAQANDPDSRRVLRGFRRSEAMDLAGISSIHEWKQLRPLVSDVGEGQQARLTLAEIHALMDAQGTRPRRPEGSRPIRMAINGFKGGSGKTMVAMHVAHYLAFRGWRVLLVDSDPQGTLSRMFDYRPEQVDPSRTLAAITQARGFAPPILTPSPTHIDGLDIIPASLAMIGSDFDVAAAFQAKDPRANLFYALVDDALARVEESYDVVLLDSPPAFSFTAIMLLWAASALLVPVPPAMGDVSATVDYCQMVGDAMAPIERRRGVPKVWAPVVFVSSRVDSGAAITTHLSLTSERIWGANRISEYLPLSAAFTTAQAQFRSVYEIGPGTIDSRTLGRARSAADQLGARLVQLFRARWLEETGALPAPMEVAT